MAAVPYRCIYRDFDGEVEAGGCSQHRRSEGIAWSWQERDSANGGREERAARDVENLQEQLPASAQLQLGSPRTLGKH